jgi:hypothetical protein
MSKTIKFAVSMPEKALEALRRKTGWTRSQFIRDAVNAWKIKFSKPSEVKEEAVQYKNDIFEDFIDPAERRRRAIAAAGRFCSDVSDISLNHDKYLEDAYSAIKPLKEEENKR